MATATYIGARGAVDPTTPSYRLFSIPAVAVATLIGSVVPGFLLLAHNRRVTDDLEAARTTALIGVSIAIVLFTVIWHVPESDLPPDSVVHAAQAGVASWYGLRSQKGILAAHKQHGGAFHSKWRAAGIGIVGGLCVAAVFFGVAYLLA